MSSDITGRCRHHGFETAASICNRCGGEYCSGCLVQPFGNSKPFCKDCAMNMGGVRSHTALPAMSKRLVRSRAKNFARLATTVMIADQQSSQLTREPELVACAGQIEPAAGVAPPIDWSRPFS